MSVARIPFTPADETKIRSLGSWMMAVAVIHFIIGGLVVLMSCCGLVGMASMMTQGLTGIIGAIRGGLGLLGGPVLLAQGALLIKAKQSFDTVVATDANDQGEIAAAFGRVKIFFIIEMAYGLVQVLLNLLDTAMPLVARLS